MNARLLSLLTALVLTSLPGCGQEGSADSGAPLGSTSAPVFSYFPMAFARVDADGGLTEQFNSGAGLVTVAHTRGSGYYQVNFANLATGANGHVQVTAEGTGNQRCRSAGWFASGTTQVLNVQCNRPDGTLADTAFSVVFFRYQQPTTPVSYAVPAAYLWVTGGSAPWAPSNYNYNPSGVLNSVSRSGPGNYTVTIPNASAYNASMMVTTYGASGAGAPFCQIGSWSASTSTTVNVLCWNNTGVAADSDFALSYSTSGPPLSQQGAHAWFDGTSASPSYSAAFGRYSGCSPASVTGSRGGNLASLIVQGELSAFDGGAFPRASFVNGYGSSPKSCKVESRTASGAGSSSTSITKVRCYDGTGVEVVPVFTFTEVTSDAQGPC
ncbi:hypothetical protein [Archangium sp.]|uniref:hypothetical protein n=1 Tax=Archangium sp. TaxID=1872627 RepID=UPI00286C9A75|nr:hypothetical protein [Archangium sp.]